MPLDSRPPSRSSEGRLRPVSAGGLRRATQPPPPSTSCNCELSRTGDSVGVVAPVGVPTVVHSLDGAPSSAVCRHSSPVDGLGSTGVMTPHSTPHTLWTRCAQRLEHGALRAIEWYQSQREGAVSPCRFFPSCSEYSHEAISTHGVGRGLWLTVRRLSRCRPFGPSGFDPVPEPRHGRPLGHAKEHRHV
jgi:hypothetical protein